MSSQYKSNVQSVFQNKQNYWMKENKQTKEEEEIEQVQFGRRTSIEDDKDQNFIAIMSNNKKWAAEKVKEDSQFFKKLVAVQKPKYLWIGCADSRVPANQIIGLQPGEVFVHRNIANLVPPSDINALAVVQYAVQHLKVEDIIVSGHFGCGGISAAFSQNDFGPLESWLSHLRELRSKHSSLLIGDQKNKEKKLVQLNVKQQVINVAKLSVVQRAWKQGRKLFIHGVVYNLKDGILVDLGITLHSLEHIPQEFKIVA